MSRCKLSIKIAVIIFVCMNLSGCFLAPFIDSFNKAGFTETDRQALLGDQIKKFQDAVYWGGGNQALKLVLPESRTEIARQLKDVGAGHEKVVDSRVVETEFKDDSYTALVQVNVRFYKIGFYVLNERLENEEWKFSLSDGWQLKSLTRTTNFSPAS